MPDFGAKTTKVRSSEIMEVEKKIEQLEVMMTMFGKDDPSEFYTWLESMLFSHLMTPAAFLISVLVMSSDPNNINITRSKHINYI